MEVICIKTSKCKTVKLEKNMNYIPNKKTKVVITEHFSNKGKSVSDIMSEVLIHKAKQVL